ncbi:hypothetical protein [Nocardia jejuensis]|uniref:hypothetical protein n=1 Tax=Nocardia jejuensis TaxID=328049 RepID=UPI00082C6FB0|nr:hypothetical protein [Nocardia jejuensis]
MKRISIVTLAAGAMVLGLAGCGSDKSGDTDSAHHATSTSTTAAARTTVPSVSTTPATVVEPPTDVPTQPAAVKKTVAPDGAQTTCGVFRELDDATEKAVIEQVLAANPGSMLEGSPNVALGTAKLACLATSYTDTAVAVAIRVAK